jgi:hypothetical protein
MDERLPECDMIQTRINKNNIWFNNLGSETKFFDTELNSRINLISEDGVCKENVAPHYISCTDATIGFTVGNTVAIASATGLVTVAQGAGSAPPDCQTVFAAGDYIYSVDTYYKVTATNSATTFTITPKPSSDISAAAITALNFLKWNGSSANPTGKIIYKKTDPTYMGIEVLWRPNLGFNQLPYAIPMIGDWKFELTPDSGFKTKVIESLASKTPDTDYKFEIENIWLEVPTLKTARISNKHLALDMNEIKCIPRPITNSSGIEQINIPSSTRAITIAFCDTRAGSVTNIPVNKFRLDGNDELNLTNLKIKYCGQYIPKDDYDLSYNSTTYVNYLKRAYDNTVVYTGKSFGDPESFIDWIERGLFLHYPIEKDISTKCTNLEVKYSFSSLPSNSQMLVFCHTVKVAEYTIQSENVTGISIYEV